MHINNDIAITLRLLMKILDPSMCKPIMSYEVYIHPSTVEPQIS